MHPALCVITFYLVMFVEREREREGMNRIVSSWLPQSRVSECPGLVLVDTSQHSPDWRQLPSLHSDIYPEDVGCWCCSYLGSHLWQERLELSLAWTQITVSLISSLNSLNLYSEEEHGNLQLVTRLLWLPGYLSVKLELRAGVVSFSWLWLALVTN